MYNTRGLRGQTPSVIHLRAVEASNGILLLPFYFCYCYTH